MFHNTFIPYKITYKYASDIKDNANLHKKAFLPSYQLHTFMQFLLTKQKYVIISILLHHTKLSYITPIV